MKRVGNIWYPNTEYWNLIARLAMRQKHRAFISEKGKMDRIYKPTGKPKTVRIKWPDDT